MKNLMLFMLLLGSASLAVAQNEIPMPVLLSFEELHPTISDPLWEEREGVLVATFNDREGLKKVFFSRDGQWLETRNRISLASLPAGVASFLKEHYALADITFLARVFRPGSTAYRVESELPGEVVVKELDENGKLLAEKRISFDPLLAPNRQLAPLPARSSRDME